MSKENAFNLPKERLREEQDESLGKRDQLESISQPNTNFFNRCKEYLNGIDSNWGNELILNHIRSLTTKIKMSSTKDKTLFHQRIKSSFQSIKDDYMSDKEEMKEYLSAEIAAYFIALQDNEIQTFIRDYDIDAFSSNSAIYNSINNDFIEIFDENFTTTIFNNI